MRNCGLKVAAWSRPVSRAGMERAARALGVSSSDVALYAATEALRAFFEGAESDTPDSVLITARAASEDFLYTFAEGNGKNYKKSQTGGKFHFFLLFICIYFFCIKIELINFTFISKAIR